MRPHQPERIPPVIRVLILGGTAEARDLAAGAAADPHLDVISSLAGATRSPQLPAGDVRIGGFGGTDRLAAFLRDERIGAVIDATHPFAATITASAVAAAASAEVPLMVLRRPGWTQPSGAPHPRGGSQRPGAGWRRVPSLEAAAALLPELGERVFLTTGRRSLAAFADIDGCWFLSRSVDPPARLESAQLESAQLESAQLESAQLESAQPRPVRSVPRRLVTLLDRGPFTVEAERALLRKHRIDVLVTKDSGGSDAKLTAAGELSIPVVMVDRPPPPPGIRVVTTVDEAHAWLATV
jgi:precorrin-6A/cobalt-precorrin-6A reductase